MCHEHDCTLNALHVQEHARIDVLVYVHMYNVYTVVSRVSPWALKHNSRFWPGLPGIKIPYVCIEAATVAP